MKHPAVSFVALILVVAAAAAIRLVRLENRPMHTDEAVHASKFADLLEDRKYVYDPDEFHGPTLNYMTVPVVRMSGGNSLAQTTETHLRLVPAICGILLIAGLWLIRDGIGRGAILCAAVLCAASPSMIFYSRYYIQEMLLVCFTFFAIAALWRSANSGMLLRFVWLAVAGACAGLMHATKETCIIALFAMVVAGLGVMLFSLLARKECDVDEDIPLPDKPRRKGLSWTLGCVVFVIVAAAVSVTFFSSFYSHWSGPWDSIATYAGYFTRAGGEGSAGNHSYPWYNYLRIVGWWRGGQGVVWTEAFVLGLAAVGLIAGLIGRGCGKASVPFVRFLCIYTVVMTVVYSTLSYKTPWCLLGFFHGMLLLAGLGASVLFRIARWTPLKAVVAVVLLVGVGHLGWQGWRGSFPKCADPGNPYVYAHSTHDVPKLANLIRDIAEVHPDKKNTLVQLVCPDNHPWPFPWYLRDFTKLDWYGRQPNPPIIVQPSDVMPLKLLRLPVTYKRVDPDKSRDYWELRPNVRLELRIAPDLWKKYQSAKAAKPQKK